MSATPLSAWSWLEGGYDLVPQARTDTVTWSYEPVDPWHLAFTPGVRPLEVVVGGEVVLRDGLPTKVDPFEVSPCASRLLGSSRFFDLPAPPVTPRLAAGAGVAGRAVLDPGAPEGAFEPVPCSCVRLRHPRTRAERGRREAGDRATPPLRQRRAQGPALRRGAVRHLSLLPRALQRHLLLLAPQAAHSRRLAVVVPVVGGDARWRALETSCYYCRCRCGGGDERTVAPRRRASERRSAHVPWHTR